MDDKKIQKQIEIYIKRVRDAYAPDRIILFGSYAQNKQSEYSDIDLLVISKKFRKMNSYDRFSKLYDIGCDLSADFNAIGFTPAEINRNTNLTTVKDALRTGRTLV